MSALAQRIEDHSLSRAANDDCFNGGLRTRTKYVYDGASRLEQFSHDFLSNGADETVGMTYNPAGQTVARASANVAYAWTDGQSSARTYQANSLNQYTSVGSTSFFYDARGNLTGFGSGSHTYSSENLFLGIPGTVSLTYDPLARLYQTVAATTVRFSYDRDELAAEYTSTNQLQRRYVHGPTVDEPIVWYEGSGVGSRRWLHADERGSVIAVSNSSGVVFALNRYDEYGEPAATNAGRFQFTGQTFIPEANLHYFKARYYSSSLGRFLQTDPIGYSAGTNLYRYVGNDPVNWTDPSGLCAQMRINYRTQTGTVTNAWGDTTTTSIRLIDSIDCSYDPSILVADLRLPPALSSPYGQFSETSETSRTALAFDVACPTGTSPKYWSLGYGAPGTYYCMTASEHNAFLFGALSATAPAVGTIWRLLPFRAKQDLLINLGRALGWFDELEGGIGSPRAPQIPPNQSAGHSAPVPQSPAPNWLPK